MNKQQTIIVGVLFLFVFLSVGLFLMRDQKTPKSEMNFDKNLDIGKQTVKDEVSEKTEDTITGAMKNGEVPSFTLRLLAVKKFDGRDLVFGEVQEKNTSYTRYYVTYTGGELTLSGIMNVPTSTPPEGGFPVLILAHGHIDTSIYTNGRGLRREQDYLAKQGFVVFHPDYRNHAQSTKTDEDPLEERLGYVEDVVNAIYALRGSSLEYIDKENIGIMGHSMGGGIAETIMVTFPDLVKGFVLYAPVSMDYRDSYERWMKERPETEEQIRRIYGAPEENPDFWNAISATAYVDRINQAVQIHHGTRDEDVPIEWSQETYELLQSKGKNVEYFVYQGEGHEFASQWPIFMERTSSFFHSRFGK
ncbi:MAG: alpha/beta fold hydrolase [Patescibacteria group bacterium]